MRLSWTDNCPLANFPVPYYNVSMEHETYSPNQTREIAQQLACRTTIGDVVCLNGGLAAGKTEFVKGFAQGLGISDMVTSPTFTIVNEYVSGRLPLYHFDVYRISSLEQMQETGYEEYFYGGGVCIIEWAELITPLLPDHAIMVNIEKDLTNGEDFRRIRIIFN